MQLWRKYDPTVLLSPYQLQSSLKNLRSKINGKHYDGPTLENLLDELNVLFGEKKVLVKASGIYFEPERGTEEPLKYSPFLDELGTPNLTLFRAYFCRTNRLWLDTIQEKNL